jgi:hypothetical protein
MDICYWNFDELVDYLTQRIDEGYSITDTINRGRRIYDTIEDPDFEYSSVSSHIRETFRTDVHLDDDGDYSFQDDDRSHYEDDDEDFLDGIDELELNFDEE